MDFDLGVFGLDKGVFKVGEVDGSLLNWVLDGDISV